MFSIMLAADAAEVRGDAVEAYDVVSAHLLDAEGRMFWRPWRVRRLAQLVVLGPLLPPWVTSRWILAQALQSLVPAARDAHRRALSLAVEVRGGEATLPGVDDIDAQCRVSDHDWVHRQLFLFELGGLATFLRHGATPDLVAGADRIHDWARAPLRVLRYVGSAAGRLAWDDLVGGDRLELLDLGAGVLVQRGECVLGRVVPVEGDLMFEGPPLVVPDDVARQVAADPAGWLEVLRREVPRKRPVAEQILVSSGAGHALLSDLPDLLWEMVALCRLDSPSVTPEAVLDETVALVRATPAEVEERARLLDLGDVWPCVAAAVVQPAVCGELIATLRPDDGPRLTALADRLVGPAATVCRALAAQAFDEAA